jgi:hypothetical protein
MRDDRADRLRAVELTQFLVNVARSDREAARRTERLAVLPVAAGDGGGFNHSN